MDANGAITYEKTHTLKCWEVFNCKKVECPAYGSKELRCWLISGVYCHDDINGEFLKKIEVCLDCKVFMANMDLVAMQATLKLINEQFKEFRTMVEDRDKELETISMELSTSMAEVLEALRKIHGGDPSVRIPDSSKIELIYELKKSVNLTAKNLGEIVDQSHEFALALAEHFDVLSRVSKGDYDARVSGDSKIELLQLLKKMTNQTIENTAKEISQRMQMERSLRNVRDELEVRVKERTSELARSNELLEAEINKHEIAEEQLKLFSEAVEEAADGVQIVDLDGYIIYSNKAVEKIYGYSREEFNGKHVNEMNADPEIATKIILPGIKQTGSWIGELMVKHKDGNEFPILLTTSMVKNRKGEPVAMIGIIRDFTERKHAEEEIKKRKDFLETIMNSSLDLIITVRKDGTLAYANKVITDLLGYNPEDIIGRNFMELIPSESKPFMIQRWNKIKNGLVGIFETKIIRADSSIIDCIVSHSQLKGFDEYLAIIKDITERRRSEELYNENIQLAYANKAKSEFLANMSHELRTPLNATIGFSELMKQKKVGGLNEKQERYLDNILTSSKFLLELINQILDLSKVEAGKMDIAIEKVSVHSNIDETIVLIKERASKRNIKIEKEYDLQLDLIETDPLRFKQILFNLLSNAVKFSKEEGGIVTIRTRKDGFGMAFFSVSDTGIGIKEEDMGKIFNKFQQLESGMTRKYGGAGLGLVISKQLVELLGGKIMAESKYGEGSTFTFLLPIETKNG
jgi:PAS domain S-box-containing protein